MSQSSKDFWIPPLAPKGVEVFNFQAKRLPAAMPPALLISGPRESGKTIAALHRVVRHLWETPRARFVILGKTIKNVKEAGVVKDITEFILPIWFQKRLRGINGLPMEYTTMDQDGVLGPKVDGATRTWFFRIRNYWGTESEVLLYSLDHDADVEDKFKNTRFSGIYIPEADKFKDPNVFRVTMHQLRAIHLKPEQHLWIADTNPAEEGPDHPLYKLFYERKSDEPDDEELFGNMEVIEMFFQDNPWLTPERIKAIKALYRHDPDLWNRYVLGKWIRLQEKSAFADVFSFNTHVMGNCESPRQEDWELLVPQEGTTEMFTGWDMGDINHAFHLLCKRHAADDPNRPNTNRFVFECIDELVMIRQKISIEDFALEALELILYWEKFLETEYGIKQVLYRHWSDQSAFAWRSASESCDEIIVRTVTNGKIMLQATGMQRPGSIKQRGKFLRRLLFENRLFISAKCAYTIEMLRNMTRIEIKSPYKHPFDSLTYALCAEEPQSVIENLKPRVSKPGRLIVANAV